LALCELRIRIGVAHDLLRRHHQAAAEGTLHEAQENFGRRVVRQTAEHRGEGEAGDREREIALAAHDRLKPRRERDHDHVCDDVGGDEPRALIGRRAERAVDRRERDVDDRRIGELHERREHDRGHHRDAPRAVFDDVGQD
jgi:hypothetical protein